MIGLKNTAPTGEVPQTVIWSFYLGAAILMICVIYSLIKIKEWPPQVYNEYNGGNQQPKTKSPGLVKLLKDAPTTFWTVGIVQFFCWFAFLFMWTYTTNTVAYNAFDTPSTESVVGVRDGSKVYDAKNILVDDNVLIVSHGQALAAGVEVDGKFYPASTVVVNGKDTVVSGHYPVYNESGEAKVKYGEMIAGVNSLKIDGAEITDCKDVKVVDYLARLNGAVTLTEAGIVATNADGSLSVEDATSYQIANAGSLAYETKTVLNSATKQYNDAGNWVGLLYAVQALGSVVWAVLLPKFRNRKFSYFLSLVLAGIGFILMSFFTNQYLLFIAFILIGCGWAAMLAWPFTILTNSLKGGNIGTYLGLFNCTICIPQIVAALAGGWILSLLSTPGSLAPEWDMMFVAGVMIIIGGFCVAFIKEGKELPAPQETPEESEIL